MTDSKLEELGGAGCADSAHSANLASGGSADLGLCLTMLAELPGDAMLDSVALSRYLSVSTRTLRRMVGRGELPQGVQLGGRRIWLAGKIRDYVRNAADRQAARAKRLASNMNAIRG